MKFTEIGIAALLITTVSAQVSNSTLPSSTTPAVVAASTSVSSTAPAPTSLSSCAVQSTFDLCLKNEDNYIKTCQEQDFACLCRWHKEKLSCWNNCPNDEGYARQQGVVSSFCSMPGANVSIARWTSTLAPTSTPLVPTSVLATSISVLPTAATNKPSSASVVTIGQGALVLIGSAAAYMFF